MSWLTDLVNKVKKPTGVRSGGAILNTGARFLNAANSLQGAYKQMQTGNAGVLGASTTTPNQPQAPQAPAAPAPNYLDAVKSKIANLNNIYASLYGDTEAVTKEKAGELQSQYNQGLDELTQGYSKSAEQLSRAYGARGIQESSYFQDAQNEAGSIFDKSQTDLTKQFQSGQAQLGQTASTQRSRIDAARNQFNNLDLNQLDEAGLQNLSTELDSAINDANSSRANFRTEGEYANELNKITPVKQQGTAQLAQKLQTLVTSSAPIFAKKQIAMGLIRAAQLNDPAAESFWTKYFTNLLNGKA